MLEMHLRELGFEDRLFNSEQDRVLKIELTLACWRKLVCEGEERDGRSKLR